MKSLLISLATVSLVLIGCSDTSTSPAPTYYMYADVNGDRFNADALHASVDDDYISIIGANSKGAQIEIKLKDTDIQEFDLGSDTYNSAYFVLGDEPSSRYETKFHIGEGRVVITRRVSTEIMGFFYFNGVNADSNVVQIQRGNFRIRLQP